MRIQKIDSFIESLRSDRKKIIYFFLLAFVFFAMVSVSRRADSVTNPQFWAEDGATWYANAYNMGPFKPFLIPVSGYFQTISRIGAAVSLLFPVAFGPLVFNIFAVSIQVLPALFFLTRRFEHILSSITMRFVIGLAVLVLPSTFETHINLSNAQWRLSLLLFLIIIAKYDQRKLWQAFDAFFLLVAGLSGPFSIVAFPIALYYRFASKNKKPLYRMVIIAATGTIQALSVLWETAQHARGQVHLGASVLGFSKILAGKIFISALLGARIYSSLWKSSWWVSGYVASLIAIVGIGMILYVLIKSDLELKLFIVYSYAIFLLTLIFPMVSNTDLSEWESMLRPNGGNRYFFLPMIAWIMVVGWTYFSSLKLDYAKKFAAVLLILFVFVGVPLGWKINPFKDYEFENQAKQFAKIPAGQSMDFTINPGWNMTLVKK